MTRRSFLPVVLTKPTASVIGISLAISGGIHAFIVDVHMREWWLAGAFFIAAALAQTLCSYAVMRSRSVRSAVVGAVLSLVLLTTWGMSRAIAIPFGPNAGTREAVAVLDLFATAAEATTVVALLVARRRTNASSRVAAGASRLFAAGVVALIFGVGSAAAAAFPTHTHGHDAAHTHPVDAVHGSIGRAVAHRGLTPARRQHAGPSKLTNTDPSDHARQHGP